MAMRSLLMLLRIVGALALLVLLYAWLHPDSLRRWTARPGDGGANAARSIPAPAALAQRAAPQPAVLKPSAGVPAHPVAAPAAQAPAPPAITGPQAAVAHWIGTRYGVASDAIAPLVAEADVLTKTHKLSPHLLIAVMAVESNFHPYIQSEAGAQGLMQVMPKIHSRRYDKFGGKAAFLDPMVSLRVGADILHDCIKLKDGSEAEGLRFYFGGGPASDTYIDKVRAEQQRLNLVARGAHVPATD